MKLDIGCGGHGSRWGGFLGVDLFDEDKMSPVRTPQPYLKLDFIHDPLPWGEASMDEVLALHVIEHMPRTDGLELLRRAWHLLKPGAWLAVTCPDLRIMCERYLAGDEAFWTQRRESVAGKPDMWPGPTLADRFTALGMARGFHQWMYDLPALLAVAQEAGIAPSHLNHIRSDSRYYGRDHETGIEACKT